VSRGEEINRKLYFALYGSFLHTSFKRIKYSDQWILKSYRTSLTLMYKCKPHSSIFIYRYLKVPHFEQKIKSCKKLVRFHHSRQTRQASAILLTLFCDLKSFACSVLFFSCWLTWCETRVKNLISNFCEAKLVKEPIALPLFCINLPFQTIKKTLLFLKKIVYQDYLFEFHH